MNDALRLTRRTLIAPEVITSTETGTGVDLNGLGIMGNASFGVQIGVAGGTGATCIVKLQDSPDNSVWTDVAGAVHATYDEDDDATTAEIGVQCRKLDRYVRAVATLAGTSPSYAIAVDLAFQTQVN